MAAISMTQSQKSLRIFIFLMLRIFYSETLISNWVWTIYYLYAYNVISKQSLLDELVLNIYFIKCNRYRCFEYSNNSTNIVAMFQFEFPTFYKSKAASRWFFKGVRAFPDTRSYRKSLQKP